MEDRETRLRRLHMRSIRRGIKEMDLILGGFSTRGLDRLSPEEVDLYEALLAENDHDLYAWASGARPAPDRYAALIDRISADFRDHSG
ncbi:MAG: succinate dehydrogenase assembly factor 2 [Shimia sp.]